MSAEQYYPFVTLQEEIPASPISNYFAYRRTNLWLLIFIVLLLVLLVIIVLVYFSSQTLQTDIDNINKTKTSVQKNVNDLVTTGQETLESFREFSQDVNSDLQSIVNDRQQIRQLIDNLGDLSSMGQEDVNNFIFDFCNLTVEDKLANDSYIIRNGSKMDPICRDVPIPSEGGGTLTFSDIDGFILFIGIGRAIGIECSTGGTFSCVNNSDVCIENKCYKPISGTSCTLNSDCDPGQVCVNRVCYERDISNS